MTKMVRVGILGAGGAGSAHATAFSQMEAVQVTALWSRTRARAEGLAGRLQLEGAQVYDRWQDLIEQAEVDVISDEQSCVNREMEGNADRTTG